MPIRDAPMTSPVSTSKPQSLGPRRVTLPLLATTVLIEAATQTESQSLPTSVDAPAITTSNAPDFDYIFPTPAIMVRNHAFGAFGDRIVSIPALLTRMHISHTHGVADSGLEQ